MTLSDPFIIVGALILLVGIINAAIILMRNVWPTTDGKVLLNRVETDYEFYNPNSGNVWHYMPKMRTIKRNALKYVFVVGEYKYENSKVYSSPITFLENRRPLQLKKGDYLKVSYCPSNPHKAYLLTSPLWPSVLVMLLGFLVVGMGFFLQLSLK